MDRSNPHFASVLSNEQVSELVQINKLRLL
jgi:hypothetical protein